MAPLIAAALPGLLGSLTAMADRLIPDKAKAAEIQLEILKVIQEADKVAIGGQLEVNKTEAASESVFVSGWRPFIGWVCGLAFAGQFLVGPATQYVFVLMGKPMPVVPQMEWETLMPVLLGMLGLAGARTFEKVKMTKGA